MKAKRVLSLTLALVLCLGLLPMTALAAGRGMGQAEEYNIIDAGGSHAAAIDADGSLWTWGNNYYGTLGNGSTKDSITPVKVMENVVAVNCGQWHTAAIDGDGALWTWGNNGRYQLGNGGVGNNNDGVTVQTVPVRIMENVTAVSCGGRHTAAIDADGALWMWGDIDQLGNGGVGNVNTKIGVLYQSVPVKVMENVTTVSCGTAHTAAIDANGALWTWGSNSRGQLGNKTHKDSSVPVKVMENVVAVSCGNSHTAAIDKNGALWTWGSNSWGQMGDGTSFESSTPVKVLENVASVSCGNSHTAAIQTDGSLWMWGKNNIGQLANSGGNEKDEDGNAFQTVPKKVLERVATVSCGDEYTIAAKTDGTLWAWGNNYHGQLGNSSEGMGTGSLDSVYQKTPIRITLGNAGVMPITPVPTAQPSTQTVNVDGKSVEFAMYALNGGSVNYIRVRDLAALLNGTVAQFDVVWDGKVALKGKTPYTGSSDQAPFNTEMPYSVYAELTYVNDAPVTLDAIQITYNGGGYTYYKLRDLAQALGFNVGWSADNGVYVETGKPYDTNN